MNPQKKHKPQYLLFLLLFVVQSLYAPVVSAQLFDFGGEDLVDINEIAGDLEERYHLNLQSIRSFGETFNVGEQKKLSPEVMINFVPADPKPGQKITAQAHPLYFANPREALYYTWYLKRDGCDRERFSDRDDCDLDGNGHVDEEDWKIEAMRIIANGGFNFEKAREEGVYDRQDTDSDGYDAKFGGDRQTEVNDLVNFSQLSQYGLDVPSGLSGRCYIHDRNRIGPLGGEIITGIIDEVDEIPDEIAEAINQIQDLDTFYQFPCNHLFPNADGETTGDGNFAEGEEEFWRTDPDDPDTANTGVGDEANVVGVGRDTFVWDYQVGDQVGVVVEGTSLIPTKYQDSSKMVMWALPKNQCEVFPLGVLPQYIKGYWVFIPTTVKDINSCLEDNLVDPREGGQASNIDLTIGHIPEQPINDQSGAGFGDSLVLTTTAGNPAQGETALFYEWSIQLSGDGSFNPRGYPDDTATWVDITEEMRDEELVGFTQGNNLASIEVDLNITDEFLQDNGLTGAFPGGVGHMRILVEATENVDGNTTRNGRTSTVIRIQSNDQRIVPYKTDVVGAGDDLRLQITNDAICNEEESLEQNVCFVAENEIIGMEIPNDDNALSNFSWQINGNELRCDSSVSVNCNDTEQTNITFFPVAGNVGDRISVTATAIDVETGKRVELSRAFQIIAPYIDIVSSDSNTIWEKYLGAYTDAEGNRYDDYSEQTMQTRQNSTVILDAQFHPGFIEDYSKIQWKVDGQIVPIDSVSPAQLSFTANKEPGSVYNVTAEALYRQPAEKRQALNQIWGVFITNSSESRILESIQIEVLPVEQTAFDSPRAFFAAIATALPEQILYLLQLALTVTVVIFGLGILFGLPSWLQKRQG